MLLCDSFFLYYLADFHSLIIRSSFAHHSLIVRLLFAYRSLIIRSSFAHHSLIIRSSFAHRSLIIRLLFAHRSLIVRSSFAYRSVRVGANGQIDLLANSLCILLMFSLNLVRVGFRLDLISCPQGR